MNEAQKAKYLEMQIKTAIPGELTLLLFSGCVKFMKQASQAIEARDFPGKNTYIQRANNIIDELIITLDHKYDISKSLRALYEYFKQKLRHANMKLDLDSIQEAVVFMTELRDTWAEALKITKSSAKPQVGSV